MRVHLYVLPILLPYGLGEKNEIYRLVIFMFSLSLPTSLCVCVCVFWGVFVCTFEYFA